MERIAAFEKVSFEEWEKDAAELSKALGVSLKESYDNIRLPGRATAGSAGYDICTPFDIKVNPGESIKIPTGVRVRMRSDYVLFIMPRSGLGSKFRFQLNNTVGVIDSDYYNSDNEGHIFVLMINDSRSGKTVELKAGAAFAQSVFLPFGITEDDAVTAERNGGFGSTGGV